MDGEAMDTAKYNGMIWEDGVRLFMYGGNGPDSTLPNPDYQDVFIEQRELP
jgi:hypothetical protein